ncbi:MAG: AraC family transcriptional regulator, partial [Synergistaceae bacterium]|nr:AraC family transcriptional regulator [Synergistaceae bacterium]
MMHKNKTSVGFKNPAAFLSAMFENGETVVSTDKIVSCRDADFALARMTTYRLFGLMDLNLFELLPHLDIEVPYEFEGGHFEIAYGVEGSFFLQTEGHGDDVFRSNTLYLSPLSSARGREIFHRGRPLKTISFNAAEAVTDALFRGLGWGELWDDAMNGGYRKKEALRPFTAASPDVANAFLQIAVCNYPDKCKRLFFESKFMEIVSRIMANEVPNEDAFSRAGEFERSQIEKIPGILMERFDSPPSIPELARDLSLNATTMKRGFKKIFGEPIYAHHRNMCLERAAMMLLDTGKSIFEISLDAGYSDCGNFCRAFKKRYRASPS